MPPTTPPRSSGPRRCFLSAPISVTRPTPTLLREDADALLILTDWAEFATLDLDRLNKTLRYPIIIDGRNLYDPDIMIKHGFTYLSVGRPAAYPVRASLQSPPPSNTRG